MPTFREETCTDTSDEQIDVNVDFITHALKRNNPTNAELVAHEDCLGTELKEIGTYDLVFDKIQGTSWCQSFSANIQNITPGQV